MHFVPLYLSIKSLTPSELYQSTKAKKEYVSTHPECAMCGSRNYLEVHHIVPVHINPALASDQDNLITLCDGPKSSNSACHRYFGHFGDFRNSHNPYIREQCILNRFVLHGIDPSRHFYFGWRDMVKEYSSAMKISPERLMESVESLSLGLQAQFQLTQRIPARRL